MTVKELMKQLIDYQMDAHVFIEVRTESNLLFSSAEEIKVVRLSDNKILITEAEPC